MVADDALGAMTAGRPRGWTSLVVRPDSSVSDQATQGTRRYSAVLPWCVHARPLPDMTSHIWWDGERWRTYRASDCPAGDW